VGEAKTCRGCRTPHLELVRPARNPDLAARLTPATNGPRIQLLQFGGTNMQVADLQIGLTSPKRVVR
jgi:hypothetical protein